MGLFYFFKRSTLEDKISLKCFRASSLVFMMFNHLKIPSLCLPGFSGHFGGRHSWSREPGRYLHFLQMCTEAQRVLSWFAEPSTELEVSLLLQVPLGLNRVLNHAAAFRIVQCVKSVIWQVNKSLFDTGHVVPAVICLNLCHFALGSWLITVFCKWRDSYVYHLPRVG